MSEENELPEGWVWTTLSSVSTLNPRVDTSELSDSTMVSFIPMAAVEAETGHIDTSKERRLDEVRRGYTAFQDGDVLFAKITPCMENGKCVVAKALTSGIGFGSTEFHVLRPEKDIHSQLLFYYLVQESFRQTARANMTGSAGQLRVPAVFLADAPYPLPSTNEQQRIVAAIEQQFSRLDAAVASLQHAKTKLKRERAAILKAAVEGTLTQEWREQHPKTEPAAISRTQIFALSTGELSRVNERRRLWGSGHVAEVIDEISAALPITWEFCKVRNLGPNPDNVVQIGPMSMKSNEFVSEGVPVLNVGCVKWGYFDLSKLDFLPLELASKFERYRLKTGDIVFTRSGTVGRCAVLREDQNNWLMTFHLLRVRLDPRICMPKYLMYVFEGFPPIHVQITSASVGSTRAGFNTRLLEELDVPLPPLPEQEQIVSEVEERLSIISQTEAEIEINLKRAERLRQTILSEAFAGRLVAQDPDDEPARVLLERVREERKEREERKKGKSGNGQNGRYVRVSDEPVRMDVEGVEQVGLWEGVGSSNS